MPTFSELQTKVARRVIDVTSATTAEIADLVNQAIRELQTKHNYRAMEKSVTYITDIDNTPINLLGQRPSDWKQYRGAPYVQRQYSRARPLVVTANKRLAEMRYGVEPDLALGEPYEILQAEPVDVNLTTSFYCFPYPDGESDWSDGEYRVVVPYYCYLPALSASSGSNWFTTNADEFIVDRATGEAFLLNQDETRATVWLQRAETARKLVQDKDAEEILSGTPALVPRSGANG